MLACKLMDGELLRFRLSSGRYHLGRADSCDCVISDDSVSESHCELQLSSEGIVLRDLGSTNGTFVEDQLIQESALRVGQRFAIGGVACQLEADPAAGFESHGLASADSKRALSQSNAPRPHPPLDVAQVSFFKLLRGAFAYPFAASGLALLAVGAILFSMVEWAFFFIRYAMIFGLIAMVILSVCSFGYLFSFMQSIILATINCEDRLPGWPEITNPFEDIVRPFFRLFFLLFACLGPGAFVMAWSSPTLGMPVLLLGAYCMPMCMLTTAVADGLGGLNPLIILSSIAKVPGPYFLVCALFVVVLGIRSGSSAILGTIPIPILPTLVFNFVILAGWAITMRALGLFYRKYKTKLAWFN